MCLLTRCFFTLSRKKGLREHCKEKINMTEDIKNMWIFVDIRKRSRKEVRNHCDYDGGFLDICTIGTQPHTRKRRRCEWTLLKKRSGGTQLQKTN